MVSDQFRRQLRQEAQQWQVDGLISPDQYARLAENYQLDSLDVQSRDRFIVILIGLGSLLLGLGVITFVAANWQAISREFKMILLISLFFATSIIGYWLWQMPSTLYGGRQRWQNRLGQGLLLLGGLLLGANLALGGQLYHRSGSPYELCLMWGLGVLAMAMALGAVPLGVLAIALTGLGYWLGIQDLSSIGILGGFNVLMQYMPILSGVLFTLLAYRCRSRVIFGMGLIALVSSLLMVIYDLGRTHNNAGGIWVAIAFTLPIALLWSYDDGLWYQLLRRPVPLERPFRSVARALVLVYAGLLCYGMSFHWAWSEGYEGIRPFGTQMSLLFTTGWTSLLNPNLVFYGVLALVGWFWLLRPAHKLGRWGLTERDVMMAMLIAVLAVLPIWHWMVNPIQAIATFVMNVVVFLLASGLIRQGLARGDRAAFWDGIALLAISILSRFFEYNTGLLVKSLAFVLCGLGVIAIGLWFERNVRNLNTPAAIAPVSSEETSYES
ncbi:DUF2157 domain-containing protein [Leptolyngbya sp. AN02str]|uniref:DUF2157 domain-containing protein n=1 Tax=Leptolyngbya sp. AN02str TaxID=3423363 RepID=UPI003D314E72